LAAILNTHLKNKLNTVREYLLDRAHRGVTPGRYPPVL